jgi:hypothetical protein
MEFILSNVPEIIQVLSLVVAAAASIAALTPSPKDDGLVAKVRKVIDFLAMNFGNAKNDEGSK